MDRGGHGPARCPLRGPRACHGQEILFPARTGTIPRAERSFSLFFTLKLSKIQHKTWASLREARARPVDKFLKFLARHGPPLMGLGPSRPAIYSSPRVEPVNRPDPCPCPPLIMELRLITF